MTQSAKSCQRISSCLFRLTPHLTSHPLFSDDQKECNLPKILVLERKNYVKATCSVCMEFPHNAVLLLCSSHDKGCRPYLCGTNYLHSNCFDLFSMACSKVSDMSTHASIVRPLSDIPQISELACPLCRGQVKGWTVVEPARKYLNNKKRNCIQDECSFIGTYEELEKHVKSEHPQAKPREVEPKNEQQYVVNTTLPIPISMEFQDCFLWVPPSGYVQFRHGRRGRYGISRRNLYIIGPERTYTFPHQGGIDSALKLWKKLMRFYNWGLPLTRLDRRLPRNRRSRYRFVQD